MTSEQKVHPPCGGALLQVELLRDPQYEPETPVLLVKGTLNVVP